MSSLLPEQQQQQQQEEEINNMNIEQDGGGGPIETTTKTSLESFDDTNDRRRIYQLKTSSLSLPLQQQKRLPQIILNGNHARIQQDISSEEQQQESLPDLTRTLQVDPSSSFSSSFSSNNLQRIQRRKGGKRIRTITPHSHSQLSLWKRMVVGGLIGGLIVLVFISAMHCCYPNELLQTIQLIEDIVSSSDCSTGSCISNQRQLQQ
jgi:hypothetical protein